MSRPGWLTYSGRFTHISGHPLAGGQTQDRESSPVKDRLPLRHHLFCFILQLIMIVRYCFNILCFSAYKRETFSK